MSERGSILETPPLIPDHVLIERIGAGAYGEVWLARSTLGTLRAVKIVRRSSFDDDRPYEREFAGIQKFEPISRSHEGFIPPEGPGTAQADLYSLGIVLYVISTGKSHRDFPEPPADLTTRLGRERWLELQAIIHRACQADPRLRYASAEAMLTDLERLSSGKSVRTHHTWQQRIQLGKKLALAAALVALMEPCGQPCTDLLCGP